MGKFNKREGEGVELYIRGRGLAMTKNPQTLPVLTPAAGIHPLWACCKNRVQFPVGARTFPAILRLAPKP